MNLQPSPIPIHDFELDAVLLGPSTRMLMLEADPHGGLFYQFARREPRALQLPPSYAGHVICIIDMRQLALLLDPETHTLLALALFNSQGNELFLFGRYWGHWVDDEATLRKSENIPGLLRRLKAPVEIDERRKQITFDYQMNIYTRDGYTREALKGLREGPVRHIMTLRYEYPSGTYVDAVVEVREDPGQRLRMSFDVREFPLAILRGPEPKQPKPAPAAEPNVTPVHPETPRAAAQEEDPLDAALRRKREKREGASQTKSARAHGASARPAAAGPKPAATPPPEPKVGAVPAEPDGGEPGQPKPAPLAASALLATPELIKLIAAERNSDRAWKLLEPNLMLGRPERTYPLIVRFAELIADRTRVWPAARLKAAFALQPGSVLGNIMQGWNNNQVLAVADENAEHERILEWLSEREVDRLLALKMSKEPSSASEARELLRVDRNADAAAIKHVWRMLLKMINVDHGRSNERAIHRRKDEIAKQLQLARNILLK